MSDNEEMAEKGRPDGPAPVLVFGGRQDRLPMLRMSVRESDRLRASFDKRFVWDGVQAYTFAETREMLSRGYDGRAHVLLLVDGEAARSINKNQLQQLRDAALASMTMLVLGVSDNDDDRARLASIGIARICAAVTFADDFITQFKAAREDWQREQIERQEKLAAAKAEAIVVHIDRNPSTGLLGTRGGVITVHASKGGAGKTFLSTNIAYALSETGHGTVLADLNPDGSADHLQFWHWISKREQLTEAWELFEYKGLTQLSRRIEHDQHYTIRAEQLEEMLVQVTDNLWMLPGVGVQGDYGIDSGDKTVRRLLKEPRWVENLIDLLSAPSGGRRYVVLDTGTNQYTAQGHVAVRHSDLVVVVVNAATRSSFRIELENWRSFLGDASRTQARIRGRRLLVVNQLSQNPGAPKLEEIKKAFEFLGADDVLAVRQDTAATTVVDAKGMPLLADKTLATQTGIGGDLMAVVNAIAGVYSTPNRKSNSGGLLKRLGRN